VAQFDLTADGGIASVGPPEPIHGYTIGIMRNPLGDQVYVPYNSSVSVFRKSGNKWAQFIGTLTSIGYMPIDMAIDSAGRYFYVIDDGRPSKIHQFEVDASTGLPANDEVRVLQIPMRLPKRIQMHPSGAFVYVLGESSKTVSVLSVYAVEQNGELRHLADTLFNEGEDLRRFVIDPSGRFLYVLNRGADPIRAFAIDAFGSLHETGRVHQSSMPNDLAVDCSGRFLYVMDGSELQGYSIQNKAGVPFALFGSPARVGAEAFYVNPSSCSAAVPLAVLPSAEEAERFR
jgi:DNA-binding beta-propeller fold protein YncE